MKHTLIFKEKKKVGVDLYTFTFSKPQDMTWISGQHGPLAFTKELQEDNGIRTLSLASSEKEEHIQFILKITDQRSTFKNELLDLKQGDKMTFTGPVGIFYPKDHAKPCVFIAGGVGVAPYRGILYDIANNHSTLNTELVYVSTKGNFAYKDEFDSFAKHDNVTIHYAEDRDTAQKLSQELIQKYNSNAHYFISGAPGMVNEYKTFLLEKGVEQDNIVLDIFTGY